MHELSIERVLAEAENTKTLALPYEPPIARAENDTMRHVPIHITPLLVQLFGDVSEEPRGCSAVALVPPSLQCSFLSRLRTHQHRSFTHTPAYTDSCIQSEEKFPGQ